MHRGQFKDRELLEAIADAVLWIADQQEDIRMALQDLQDAVTELETAEAAEEATLGELVTELKDATDQIASLQAQLAAGNPVSEQDLEDLTNRVAAVTDKANAAVTAAGTQPAPEPPGPDEPPAPGPEPEPAPDAPTAERSVYTFDGDPSTIDPQTWTLAQVQTTDEPARPLYLFAGDTAPGDVGGDGVQGLFHVYTGALAPVAGAEG